VVHHIGRQSGSAYQTPVNVFDHDGSLLVALTYGPSADWVQNVLANGGSIRRNGVDLAITSVAVVGREAAWPYLPRFVRGALRVLSVKDFLTIEVTPPG